MKTLFWRVRTFRRIPGRCDRRTSESEKGEKKNNAPKQNELLDLTGEEETKCLTGIWSKDFIKSQVEKTPGPFKRCSRGWKRTRERCDLIIKKLQQYTKVCSALTHETTWLAICVCQRSSAADVVKSSSNFNSKSFYRCHRKHLGKWWLAERSPAPLCVSSFYCHAANISYFLQHILQQRTASPTKKHQKRLLTRLKSETKTNRIKCT